jgi:prophage antirepressor-like protein/predicted GIY-YIG superfamily endonuclease
MYADLKNTQPVMLSVMQPEILKQKFNNTNVSVFGSYDEPLIRAYVVGEILGINDVIGRIRDFDSNDKVVVRYRDSDNTKKLMTLLTISGAKELTSISKQVNIAESFKKWLSRVLLPALAQCLEKEELARRLKKARAENKILKAGYKPKVTYHPIDINEFANEPCVYLIQVESEYFKFGWTDRMYDRWKKHKDVFLSQGHTIQLVNIWKCNTSSIMHAVEDYIKKDGKLNNTLVKRYGQIEILHTDDIQVVIDKITKYVTEQNNVNAGILKLRKIELINDGKRLDLEKSKADAERVRLEIELFKLKNPDSGDKSDDESNDESNDESSSG